MTIDELKQIMPPPPNPVDASGGWTGVEGMLGLKLPQDYKDFIEVYGTGIIGDLILVYNPFSQNNHLNITLQAEKTLAVLHDMKENDPEIYDYPYLPFPEEHGVFPFGRTVNGDELFWKTEGDPDMWSIVEFHIRYSEHEMFPFNLTEWLEKLIKGEIKGENFPDNLDFRPPIFISIEE